MRRSSRRKNSTKIFITVTIAAALIFAVSQYFFSKKDEKNIVAKIGNETISRTEIEQKLSAIFDGQNQEMAMPAVENLPKEVIEILAKEIYVDRQLTKEAAKSAAAKDAKIQERIAAIKDKIIRQAYVDSVVKAEVTEEKISQKYLDLSSELTGKKEYLISHIVVKTQEEAGKISKEFKAKKPLRFADAAKKYSLDQESASKGGELGYVLEDNMIKEISDAISKLKKDEISTPIQTKFGWHLVKFSDVRDAKALPFESVKENIREQLTQDKLNEINSKFAKDAKVEILIELKEIAPEEAKPAEVAAESAATPTTAEETASTTSATDEKVAEEPVKTEEKSDAKSKNKKSKDKKKQ